MLENDLNMIDLVLTHLTHPWGPRPPWTLETFGDPWRPLAAMPENGQNGHFHSFIHSFISWSITLKIEFWAPYTHWHAVLKGQVILRQKAYFGPDY